jgi:hypothetical protein
MSSSSPLLVDALKVAAQRRLDLLGPRDVISWANNRIASGDDASTLLSLALMSDTYGADVDEQLEQLLDEIGAPRLDDVRAAMIVARMIAQKIVDGSLSPIEGSRTIWWRIVRRVPEAEPRLRQFIGLASEWEDAPSQRSAYEKDIEDEAARLLQELPELPE